MEEGQKRLCQRESVGKSCYCWIKNRKSFFEALKAYKEDQSKFLGRPKLPKYKHKTEGRNILVYTV